MSRARCRPANGPISTGVEKYSTEVVLQGFNRQLTMLDARGRRRVAAAKVPKRQGGADFGSSGAPRARQPATAGAGGKRGDMDDEIPF